MNESWNANRYIKTTVDKEASRLTRLDAAARRDIYALRRRDLHAQYTTHYYRMMSGVLVLTLFTTLLLLVPAAMWRANRLGTQSFVVVDALLLLFYLCVLLVVFVRFGRRHGDVWQQRSWGAGQKIADELKGMQSSCSK